MRPPPPAIGGKATVTNLCCKHDCYRGDGAFGQFCIVLPKQDAVIAITGEYGDMQRVLNAAWEHLLPAFAEARMPADEKATVLTKKLAVLALPLPPVC